MPTPLRVAIIGSGPAGLMAADYLVSRQVEVHLYEQKPKIGYKLYIAGSSGLNITHDQELKEFCHMYRGLEELWPVIFSSFFRTEWLAFLEQKLNLSTFLGTSRRYFISTMHAGLLLKNWKKRLSDLGIYWHLGEACLGFAPNEHAYTLTSQTGSQEFDALIFALGGGSYYPKGQAAAWPQFFAQAGLPCLDFAAANVGYQVAWSQAFLQEAEGLPIKNICFHSPRGSKKGDLLITAYGLEGTPIYTYGCTGPVTLDLKPDQSLENILKKLQQAKENLSPMRRIQKNLGLSPGALALLYHHNPLAKQASLEDYARLIKAFPLQLLAPQDLSESISSTGGLPLEQLNAKLELKAYPGVYCVGEMLDWDAPTGGYLIQAAVSQGYFAAENLWQKFRPLS